MSVISIIKPNAGIRIAKLESPLVELLGEQRFRTAESQALVQNTTLTLKTIWQLIYSV